MHNTEMSQRENKRDLKGDQMMYMIFRSFFSFCFKVKKNNIEAFILEKLLVLDETDLFFFLKDYKIENYD